MYSDIPSLKMNTEKTKLQTRTVNKLKISKINNNIGKEMYNDKGADEISKKKKKIL